MKHFFAIMILFTAFLSLQAKKPIFSPSLPLKLELIYRDREGHRIVVSSGRIVSHDKTPVIKVSNMLMGSTLTIYDQAGCRGQAMNTDISQKVRADEYYYKLNLEPGRAYSFSAHVSGMQKPCSDNGI